MDIGPQPSQIQAKAPMVDRLALLVPLLQTLVFLTAIGSVTFLGVSGVIDAPAITAIVGAIVGSVGVLAGQAMARTPNGNGGRRR